MFIMRMTVCWPYINCSIPCVQSCKTFWYIEQEDSKVLLHVIFIYIYIFDGIVLSYLVLL